MFIVTARLPKKKLLAGCFTLLCCCVVIAAAVILSSGGRAVSASAEVKGIRDNDDRVGFLSQLGWIVSPEPVVQKMQALVQRLAEQYCAPDGDKTSV